MSLDGGCPYSAERQEKQLKEEQLAKLNNMPVLSEQRDPQQTIALSTDREISTIPMAGIHEGKKWIYPSEQVTFTLLLY